MYLVSILLLTTQVAKSYESEDLMRQAIEDGNCIVPAELSPHRKMFLIWPDDEFTLPGECRLVICEEGHLYVQTDSCPPRLCHESCNRTADDHMLFPYCCPRCNCQPASGLI